MSVTAGEEQYLWSHAGAVPRENLFLCGLSDDLGEKESEKGSEKGSGKGLVEVRWSLFFSGIKKSYCFSRALGHIMMGVRSFCVMVSQHVFVKSETTLCCSGMLLGLSADMLHPSLGVCLSSCIFRRHLSKLPSTHSGWTSRWIKISPQRCGGMPVAEIVPNLGQVIPSY